MTSNPAIWPRMRILRSNCKSMFPLIMFKFQDWPTKRSCLCHSADEKRDWEEFLFGSRKWSNWSCYLSLKFDHSTQYHHQGITGPQALVTMINNLLSQTCFDGPNLYLLNKRWFVLTNTIHLKEIAILPCSWKKATWLSFENYRPSPCVTTIGMISYVESKITTWSPTLLKKSTVTNSYFVGYLF